MDLRCNSRKNAFHLSSFQNIAQITKSGWINYILVLVPILYYWAKMFWVVEKAFRLSHAILFAVNCFKKQFEHHLDDSRKFSL